ncbi:M48 family metallopeptidase [Brachybacterium vulturis]|uniref:M48 metallopeptidase family protein n=1 Tax=Brachybacterium vulturis TaxID=2017484 RepID=UPI00373568A8
MNDLVLHEHVAGPRGERVLVRRSARRRRTVSISRRDGDLLIAIPATFSARQERQWVTRMVDQLVSKEARRAPARRSDDALLRMAREVSELHLGGRAHPSSVTWSSRQNQRWGSCTPTDGTIRLSHQLQGMPDYVVRSVMMHELVHLLVPGHGPEFKALMANYPLAEKAQGFLDGVSWSKNLPGHGTEVEDGADGEIDSGIDDAADGAAAGTSPVQPARRAR